MISNKILAIQWAPNDPPKMDVNDLQKAGQGERVSALVDDAQPVKLIKINGMPVNKPASFLVNKPELPIDQQIEEAEKELINAGDDDQKEVCLCVLNRLKFKYAQDIFPRCAFPWETLPDKLTLSLKQLARSCATNPMHLVGIVFAIMGAAVGRHIEVKIKDSWIEPLIYWVMSLLDSGDGKTPALNLLCKILEEWQRKFDRLYQEEMRAFETADKDSQFPEPKPPGGVYTTDYTIEALFRDQRYNGGSLVINDEATSFFDGQNQYKGGGKGTDRQQMLKLYDGSRARKIRVKDVLTLEGSRISIAGGTQPQVFRRVFESGDGDIFQADGTLFRFMMTYDRGFYPSTTESWEQGNRGYLEWVINNAINFCQAQTIMNAYGETEALTTPLTFTHETLEYFIDWQNDYKAIRRFFPDALGGFLPKMFGWVARIAGALKCLDEFQHGQTIIDPSIDLDLLKRAIKISEFYMGQNSEIMREMTLKTPGERTFTDQEKHLCLTLQELKPDIDNGRLAVAFMLDRFNQGAGRGIKLKNSQALTALIRSAGLIVPNKRERANGYAGYICLTWNNKVETLLNKFSTSSTSLQPQGFECVENSINNSTNSTNPVTPTMDGNQMLRMLRVLKKSQRP